MHIAIEGCLHGELDKVYSTLLYIQQQKQIKIDLLICCGDFQSLRNKEDMYCMACPEKYMAMGNFYEYYTGKKKAPILTIFIGGNHEASNYLRELHFGGWVAENIYYLGSSNVIWVKKGNQQIRIGGISGIYKDYHFNKGHFEKMPLNDKSKKSVYHIREFDVYKLSFISNNLDVFLSHDWPQGIHKHGNVDYLLRIKPYFQNEIQNNILGNPAMTYLMSKLGPKYWFSAHLHVKFSAEVKHENKPHSTKFLALDKCLPQRNFLQVLNISEENKNMNEEITNNNPDPSSQPVELYYDAEWLAIQKLLASRTPLYDQQTRFFHCVSETDWQVENFEQTLERINKIKQELQSNIPNLKIPLNFVKTVEAYDPKTFQNYFFRDKLVINNQTGDYLKMLDIKLDIFKDFLFYDHEKKKSEFTEEIKNYNEEEIDLGLDLGSGSIQNQNTKSEEKVTNQTEQKNNAKEVDANEIDLGITFETKPAQKKPSEKSVDINLSIEDLPFK